MYQSNWFVKTSVMDSHLSYYVSTSQAVLFTNLGSPISVLYCTSFIILKMHYLHSNGAFLVVKTYINSFAQTGICTFNLCEFSYCIPVSVFQGFYTGVQSEVKHFVTAQILRSSTYNYKISTSYESTTS